MRPGVRLGIDPGEARIGVARCDPSGLVATPVETVRRGPGDLARLAALVAEEAAVEVVVGLPRSLSGREGPAAVKVRQFAGRLARRVAPVPVRLCDERLSTVSAEAQLRDRGRRGARRRAVVDQAAAVIILQHALDSERSSGRPPGDPVVADGTGPRRTDQGRTGQGGTDLGGTDLGGTDLGGTDRDRADRGSTTPTDGTAGGGP